MKVKIDLEDEKLRERIVKIVQEVGFLINESSDVIITDNLKEQDRWMILVSENWYPQLSRRRVRKIEAIWIPTFCYLSLFRR